MTALRLFAQMGIVKAGKLDESVTMAILERNPELGQEVEINRKTQHCQELAVKVSEWEGKEEASHKKVLDLEATLADTIKAATMIGAQIKATTDDTVLKTLNTQLKTLMDTVTQIGGDNGDGTAAGTLFEARQDHAAAEQEYHEWQTVHAGAVAQLADIRRTMEQAQHDMEHAREQLSQERERQAQAERDAGLKSGLDSGNVVMAAMQKRAEELKQQARAAQINTQALKESHGQGAGNAADIVKQTLAAAPQETPMERLARLNKAA